MKAMVITKHGGPEVLQLQEIEEPKLLAGHALVRIRATALNRADLLQRRGIYRPSGGDRADIPGLEFAGEVEAVGEKVDGFQPGDRVMGLLPGQGYAEKALTPAGMLLPVPDHLGYEEAACIPETFITAYVALFVQLAIQTGESVLIHAAGSGVGVAAVQLAKIAGCTVLGTAGSDEKLKAAASLGLDVGINYKTQNFEEVVLRETGHRGVNAILDMVGAPYWEQNVRCLTPQGRLVVVGFMGGAETKVNLGSILSKRLRILGSALGPQPLEDKIALTRDFAHRILPFFGSGRLKTIVDRSFPLNEAAQAHAYMEANKNFGKIILTVRA